MLEIVHGDLFATTAPVIVNTVNCVGAHGRGVAKGFADRYPAYAAVYRDLCRQGRVHPGRIIVHPNPAITIVSAATKDHWRNGSQIAWIESIARLLASAAHQRDWTHVALPPLGCGNGGLHWPAVHALLEIHLAPHPCRFTVYR